MSKVVNVGIIGLGGISQVVHLPILNKLRNVKIAGVSEINKSRLKSVAAKYNIEKQYLDYKDMLNDESLDAVIIATPTNTHKDIALDALEANKNLLIEKPIALNYQEAKEIFDAAEKKKLKVMVGMNLRFRPDAMLLKSLINSGELGEIFYVKCGWIRKQSSDQSWFLKREKAGGGVLTDLGTVLLDLAIWLAGYQKIKTVSVQKYHTETKAVEDSAVGLIRLEKGASINFEVSWSLHSERDSLNLSIFGKNGTAQLHPLRAYRRVGSTQIDYTPATSSSEKNLYKKSYENELKHFITAVSTNAILPISSAKESLYRMKLLEAIYKSAELNKEVEL